MSAKVIFAVVVLWSVFLVCIGTFGGKAGADAAGAGAVGSGIMLFFYGMYCLMRDM